MSNEMLPTGKKARMERRSAKICVLLALKEEMIMNTRGKMKMPVSSIRIMYCPTAVLALRRRIFPLGVSS